MALSTTLENFSISYTSDLISEPADKSICIYTKKNKYELIFNYRKNCDLIRITNLRSGFIIIKQFKKKRSTDFINEIKHILEINSKEKYKNSFIQLKYGLKVQSIINSIFRK